MGGINPVIAILMGKLWPYQGGGGEVLQLKALIQFFFEENFSFPSSLHLPPSFTLPPLFNRPPSSPGVAVPSPRW